MWIEQYQVGQKQKQQQQQQQQKERFWHEMKCLDVGDICKVKLNVKKAMSCREREEID